MPEEPATPYDPPEDKIAEVLARTGSDPRKLAIAYLRARKRALAAEMARDVVSHFSDALVAAVHDDIEEVDAAVSRARRRATLHEDISKS